MVRQVLTSITLMLTWETYDVNNVIITPIRRDAAVPSPNRFAAARTVVGFVPWILFAALAGFGRPVALGAGFAVALVLCAWRWRRGALKTMELAALGFFALQAIVTTVVAPHLPRAYDAVLASLALAAIAWGTLAARSPFTLEYARDDWPPEYWDAPLFRRTNTIITAVWGCVFTLNAVVGLLRLTGWLPAWVAIAASSAATALGVFFSIRFPRWYPRRWAAGEIAARNPYPWPAPAFPADRPRDDTHHDVVVVGAGIGGLTAAALLARRGLDVLVLDQHFLPGGFCTSWPRQVRRGDARLRYVFDAGVHDVSGLGPRGPVRHLLEALGIAERLEWRRMTHEYILPGLRLKVPERADDFVTMLGERFPAERAAIRSFFAEIEAVYRELYADVETTGGVPAPPVTVDGMLDYPPAHPHAFRWMNVPFGTMLDAYFSDRQLKELMSVLSGYLSDDPGSLTVGAMAPIFGYYFDGGHYPVGGSQALADALVAVIREHGGEVSLRTPVKRILVEHGRAIGVELADGRVHHAEAVVSNADLRRTFAELVGPEHLPRDFARHIERVTPSASAFVVFLGVDYVPDIEPITMLTVDGRGLGIAMPSRVDPSLAPAGHSSLTLVTLLPHTDAEAWDRKAPGYAARKHALGDELIALAERALPGLRDHIVYRQEGTPATFARYAWTTGGAIYGPAVDAWRPPSKSPIERLVLAGAGVFPGAGVEAVVISGTLAADAICPVPTAVADAQSLVVA
jgi:phytoene dehydrogenase-like protein